MHVVGATHEDAAACGVVATYAVVTAAAPSVAAVPPGPPLPMGRPHPVRPSQPMWPPQSIRAAGERNTSLSFLNHIETTMSNMQCAGNDMFQIARVQAPYHHDGARHHTLEGF